MIHRRQPGATHPGTRHTARSFLLVTGVMLFAALVVANTADSANKPPSLRGAANGRPDLDQRFEGQHVAPTAQQRAQLRKLGDVEIGWTALGTPHSLRARNGALTKPDRGAPDDIARGFLRENAELSSVKKPRTSRTSSSGATPGSQETSASSATANAGRAHGARHVDARRARRTRPHLVGRRAARPDPRGGGHTTERDRRRGGGSRRADLEPQPVPALRKRSSSANAATFDNTLAVPDLDHAAPVEAKFVSVPSADGTRTAWRVRAEIASNADYETLVDAQSGELLYRQNQWSSSGPTVSCTPVTTPRPAGR